MKKYVPVAAGFFVAAAVLLAASLLSQVAVKNDFNRVEISGKTIVVEIARTPAEMSQGLMHRESLCEECGMLFVFGSEGFHSFWMKNTLIPLDMVFISADSVVVDLKHATPCVSDPCETYSPSEKALYVLEVNAGTFDGAIVGQKAEISIS